MNFSVFKKYLFLIFCGSCCLFYPFKKTFAQIAVSANVAYSQNFDGMDATLNLPTNWRMAASTASPTWGGAGTTVTQQASLGTPSNGGTYNWGSSAAERAVGAMTSGTFNSPNNLLVYYQNTSNTGTITQLTISYNAERYRINAASASIEFYYSLNGTSWLPVSSGDIVSSLFPTGSSSHSFPPSLTINRSFSITSLNIRQSEAFYLRWNINTTGANSQGIGIDDVSVTPTFVFPTTNIASNPGVNWVGANQSNSVPINCNSSSPFVMKYRRLATTNANPTDGRGQWTTTLSAQSAGGDVTLQNMNGGASGFLFISGGACGSTGNFNNKWAFGGTGQAALNGINDANYYTSGGVDMGLNMNTAGHYTFVLRDAGLGNSNFYVGFTQNAPVTIAHTPASQLSLNGNYSITVQATLSAAPSAGELVFLRYKINNNDFSTASTSIVQATVSGTTVTFTIPTLSVGAIVNYYLFTSTRTLADLNSLSESDRSLAVLRFNDNNNANFSYTVPTPQTYTWIGGASGSWTTATNWSPNGVPSNSDAIIFINETATIVTNVTSVNLRSITMSGAGSVNWQAAATANLNVGFTGATNPILSIPAGKQFSLSGANAINIGINTGFTVAVNGRISFTQGAHRLTAQSTNAISFESGSLFETLTGFTGNPFGSAGTNGSVIFRNGSTYEHTSGANPFGGNSITTFESQSLYRYLVTSPVESPSLSGRTYGNFEVGIARVINNATGTNGFTLNNLSIPVAGATWNIQVSGISNINGNISIAAGSAFNYNPAVSSILNLNTNSQTINTNVTGIFSVGNEGSVLVKPGADVQIIGETIIAGTGAFIVENGSTLGISSANGIAAIGSNTGNVQTSTRTFNPSANYRYQGNTNQITGSGLPTFPDIINALLISNNGSADNNTVTLTNNNTTTTRLDLNSGFFAAGTGQHLYISNGGRINGNGGNQPNNATAGTIIFEGGGQTNGFQQGSPSLYSVIINGGVDFNGNPNTQSATILNRLQLNPNSFVSDAPFYSNVSTLIYNNGGFFGRNSEWGSASNQGYPHHVIVQGNTTLDLNTNPIAPTELSIGGDLTIGNDNGWGRVYFNNNMNKPLYVKGNLSIGNANAASASSELFLTSSATITGGDLWLEGNFTRSANSFFTDNNRATFLKGTGNSTIFGSGAQGFSYLFIDKTPSATITLNSPVTISQLATFTNGVVISSPTNPFVFQSGSSAADASFNSFVEGPVQKTGNSPFTFPVGRRPVTQGAISDLSVLVKVGGYRPIGISGLTNNTSSFTAHYRLENPQNNGWTISDNAKNAGLQAVSRCEYWDLTRQVGTETPAVTLSWSNNSVEGQSQCNVGPYILDQSKVVVVPFFNNQWGDQFAGFYGQTSVTAPNSAQIGLVSWDGKTLANPSGVIDNYTRFVLGSIDWRQAPLPFSLTKFNAIAKSKYVSLEWNVLNSQDILTYSVERSRDGIVFMPLGFIDADPGRINGQYQQFDLKPFNGNNYYRIKAIDRDQKATYSSIQRVMMGIGNKMEIGPIPTASQLTIRIPEPEKVIQIELYNASGQQMKRINVIQSLMQIDLSHLPAGQYLLRLITNDGIESKTFIKQ